MTSGRGSVGLKNVVEAFLRLQVEDVCYAEVGVGNLRIIPVAKRRARERV